MTNNLKLSHHHLVDAMEDFIPLVMQSLSLDSLPKIIPVDKLESTEQPSFAQFDFVDEIIYVAVNNRHIIDILRSIAHEMVHYRQNLESPLNSTHGQTGSDIENEANLVAGVIMRNFAKRYPYYFSKGPVILGESKRRRKKKNKKYIYGAWGPWGVNTGGEIGAGDGSGGVEESKKDACYRKVKAAYKVWPSAYASGALVQCRKIGAANWGKKRKKKK